MYHGRLFVEEYGHANLAFQYTSDGGVRFIHPQPLAILLSGNLEQ